MTTITPVYGTPVTLTHTLANLASDGNLVAGRESAAADNQAAGNDAIDCIVGGKVTTGTSPTASRLIEIWLIGSYDGTSYSGGGTGSDANFTPQSKTLLKMLQQIPTDGTSDKTYTWGPFSVADAFGGTMPPKWSVYVVHNTGVALNATAGNHETKYMPLKYESA